MCCTVSYERRGQTRACPGSKSSRGPAAWAVDPKGPWLLALARQGLEVGAEGGNYGSICPGSEGCG